jgi:hypothetical protein
MNTNLCCNYAQKLKAQADGVDRKVVALVVCFNGPLHEHPTPRELLINLSFRNRVQNSHEDCKQKDTAVRRERTRTLKSFSEIR